jgi:hypothetical protein
MESKKQFIHPTRPCLEKGVLEVCLYLDLEVYDAQQQVYRNASQIRHSSCLAEKQQQN